MLSKYASHPNIGSLKAAIEDEWKNIGRIYFEAMQIISKACWYNNRKKSGKKKIDTNSILTSYEVKILFVSIFLFCCLFLFSFFRLKLI